MRAYNLKTKEFEDHIDLDPTNALVEIEKELGNVPMIIKEDKIIIQSEITSEKEIKIKGEIDKKK